MENIKRLKERIALFTFRDAAQFNDHAENVYGDCICFVQPRTSDETLSPLDVDEIVAEVQTLNRADLLALGDLLNEGGTARLGGRADTKTRPIRA